MASSRIVAIIFLPFDIEPLWGATSYSWEQKYVSEGEKNESNALKMNDLTGSFPL